MNIAYLRYIEKDFALTKRIQFFKEIYNVDERYIYMDKHNASAGAHNYTSAYELMKKTLREGDVLHIETLKMLGKTYREILAEWAYIRQVLKVHIVVIHEDDLFNTKRLASMGEQGVFMEEWMTKVLIYIGKEQQKTLLRTPWDLSLDLIYENMKKIEMAANMEKLKAMEEEEAIEQKKKDEEALSLELQLLLGIDDKKKK